MHDASRILEIVNGLRNDKERASCFALLACAMQNPLQSEFLADLQKLPDLETSVIEHVQRLRDNPFRDSVFRIINDMSTAAGKAKHDSFFTYNKMLWILGL